MYKLLIAICCMYCVVSCNEPQPGKNKNATSKNHTSTMQEGKDYIILKRIRSVDNQGFNQPVEVGSFLLPANWQVTSGVVWNGRNKCIPEMVQASMNAKSPDGAYELIMLPVTQFDWSDDPVYLDAMQRGFNMHSCTIKKPSDAAGYIRQSMAPAMHATIKSAETITALQQKMDEGAMQMTNAARQAGNSAYSHRGSAAEGTLSFTDGSEGIALCTLMQTIVTMPGTRGSMANNYQCYVSMRVVVKYKTGNEQMARKILSTFLGSARVNPLWQQAVQAMFVNIGRSAQIEIGKQIEITHQAQEEISNGIIRNWEKSSSNSGENSTQQFSQYLRGVDSWTDESGSKVELTSGYNNAWSRSDGSYLLTDNPAIDPNVTFNEGWKRLSK